FLGVTRELKSALSMGGAVTFVMLVTGLVVWPLQHYVLDPLGLGFLQTAAFILIIAVLVQLLEMFIRKMSPALYEAFGIYLHLISSYCPILRLDVVVVGEGLTLARALICALGSAASSALDMLRMAGIRQVMELAVVLLAFQGTVISLLSAGLMALAFLG